jgi:hypothetical protein
LDPLGLALPPRDQPGIGEVLRDEAKKLDGMGVGVTLLGGELDRDER